MERNHTLGIILPQKTYNKILNPDPRVKAILSSYEEAAKLANLQICFFRFKDICPGHPYVTGYVKKGGHYELHKLIKPGVIYKRCGHSRKRNDLLKALTAEGITIFNMYRDNEKYNIWKIVQKNKKLAPYQPVTKIASVRNVKRMMLKNSGLFIKPNKGETGKGIMKIEKTDQSRWCLYYIPNKGEKGKWRKVYFTKQLPLILRKRIKNRKYLVQQKINLAMYSDKPFDLRVSVQRNGEGKWDVSAVICKLAKEGQFLTNMGQGATATTLDHVLTNHPFLKVNQVKKDICELTIDLAKLINKHKPFMADFGFDIGLSADGTPYLIEVNHISDYGTFVFKDGKLITEEWKKVFINPLKYARYLYEINNQSSST